MNQQKQSSDLNLGRGWLNRAAEMLDSCEDHVSDAEFARAAAAIGNGFIALAHAERAAASMEEVSSVRQAIECTCEHPPAIGQLHRPNCPAYVAPVGEAAHWLEGDDEIFTEADRG